MTELWEVLTRNFPEFRAGFLVTLQLVAVSFLIAMGVGVFVAALRVQPLRWLQRVGVVYVEVFRNIPLVVLLIISYAGLRRAGLDLNKFVSATAALGLYTAAYIAEAIRSGVFAVGQGQIEASLSLGFSYRETLRRIVLPQAIRTVIPPIGNLIIAMIKNSAVIGATLALATDLLKTAREVNNDTLQTIPVFF
ncbi:MAG: amino acid ABC transporter permease, partial [Actinomycetota bacterium]|nr:amino acid ABC transporter permease [Actinomycetota bacterium]